MTCCTGAAARLPSPLRPLAQTPVFRSTTRSSLSALPPAFLAPRVHAQSFSVQHARLAEVPSSKKTAPNSAQKLRGTLRRLGLNSKWQPKPPGKAAADHKGSGHLSQRVAGRRSPTLSDRGESPTRERDQDRGFRLRAKALLDHLTSVIRDLSNKAQATERIPPQIDAEINKALAHFESEMKALRVMLKSKDVLVDPDNAWKSASRIKAPYNAAIRLCLQSLKHERAFKLLNQMKKDGIFPSAATFSVVINGLTRALNLQASNTKSSPLAERKESQRIREVYEDLEKLWKQSFPQYFQRHGAPRSKDALALDRDDFHAMTEQARRNLVSQQASVQEARQFPKILTNAIGAYLSFLRVTNARDELNKLFDILFPPAIVDAMAKGLLPDGSPQEKLDLANGKLSRQLPLGDMTTFSAILMVNRDAQDPDRLPIVERVWTRFEKMMNLEHHELLSRPSSPGRKKQAVGDAGDGEPHTPRFEPDDQLMIDVFNRLVPPPNADPAAERQLGVSVLSGVYGLNFERKGFAMIRDPEYPGELAAAPIDRFVRREGDAIDGSGHPVAELRSTIVASCVFRLLAHTDAYDYYVSLFNYLWARAHTEKQDTSLEARKGASAPFDNPVFGSTLRAAHAMRIFWHFSQTGDPIGARVLLAAMKRAADSASGHLDWTQEAPNRRARRQNARSSTRDEVGAEWTPSHTSYDRAMHAVLVTVLKKPQGLTAAVVEGQGKYDAWAEAKAFFSEWRDFIDARSRNGRAGSRPARWGVDESDNDASRTSYRSRSASPSRDAQQDRLSRVHSDTICSLFLHVASACALQKGDQASNVAREALALLEQRLGLEQLVSASIDLQHDSRSSATASSRSKSYTLPYLHMVLSTALDTSSQTFAPKADVELWKRVKKMFPASNAADGTNLEMRGRPDRGNPLLLTKDDYRELEAEGEEDDVLEAKEEMGGRGSQKMQRRSRHVEQELERWVRGASS